MVIKTQEEEAEDGGEGDVPCQLWHALEVVPVGHRSSLIFWLVSWPWQYRSTCTWRIRRTQKVYLLFEPYWMIFLTFSQEFLGVAWLTILGRMSAQNFSKQLHFPFFPFIHCCSVFWRWVIGIHQSNILKISIGATFLEYISTKKWRYLARQYWRLPYNKLTTTCISVRWW